MMRSMMGGMAGMGGMYGQAGGAQADLKKQMKTLTRTDFLIQFVWQPPKAEDRPKTDEERAEKLKNMVALIDEAEKNNPAIKVSKEEIAKELEAVSRKKSEQIETQIGAIGAGQPAAAGAPGAVPGASPPPGATAPAPGAK
jgi:type IV pilus assembly protein PilM